MATHTDNKYGIMYKKKAIKPYNTLYILNVLGVYFKVKEIQKKSFTFLMMRLVILKELI